MRILHVVPTYVPAWRHGGPVFAVHGLARAQARLGNAVTVFTTDVNGPERLDVPVDTAVDMDGVSVHYFPVVWPRHYYRSPAMRTALARAVSSFDVVHTHSLFLSPPVVAGRAARQCGVPYLVAPRGMLIKELVRRQGRWRKSLWLMVFGRKLLRGAAALHVESELEAREARAFGIRLPTARVVANGIEAEENRGNTTRDLPATVCAAMTQGRFVLYLGRISWKKGIDRLIEAMRYVPGTPLVIVGNDEEGLQPRLERLAHRCDVASRVIFAGPVWGDAKASILQRASCLVLPSYSENFGNVVLEAMAEGTPVVVTPEVGLAAEVEASGAGLVVAGTPEELGGAIATLVNDAGSCADMGGRGRRVAKEKYVWPAVAQQMLDVYAEVIAAVSGTHVGRVTRT